MVDDAFNQKDCINDNKLFGLNRESPHIKIHIKRTKKSVRESRESQVMQDKGPNYKALNLPMKLIQFSKTRQSNCDKLIISMSSV